MLYTYVASVCFKCFIYFKRMLQVYYLDVAYVAVDIHLCCKCIFQMFHLFQTYVAASALYCECFHQQAQQQAGGTGVGGPHLHAQARARNIEAKRNAQQQARACVRAYVQQHVGAGGQAHSCSCIRDRRGRSSIRSDSATCGVGARAGQAQASGRSDASHTLVTRSPSFLKVFQMIVIQYYN